MRLRGLCALGILFVTATTGRAGQGGSGVCDRACLTGLVDAYFVALVAHDPSRAPIAQSAKFTENTGTLTPGEGLWIGASEAPTFKIYVPDPQANQIGVFAALKEFDRPVLLALRLRVQKGQITEIEHIIARTLNENGLKNLVTPRPGLLSTVLPSERVPRQDMLRIANSYYDSILQSSGKVTPYADDCERHENGMATARLAKSAR